MYVDCHMNDLKVKWTECASSSSSSRHWRGSGRHNHCLCSLMLLSSLSLSVSSINHHSVSITIITQILLLLLSLHAYYILIVISVIGYITSHDDNMLICTHIWAYTATVAATRVILSLLISRLHYCCHESTLTQWTRIFCLAQILTFTPSQCVHIRLLSALLGCSEKDS